MVTYIYFLVSPKSVKKLINVPFRDGILTLFVVMVLNHFVVLLKVTLGILLHLFIIIFYAATISIDLSVAFDSMNHNILLFECPSIWQSLTIVEWFSGYISE